MPDWTAAEALERLGEKYALRYLPHSRRWLGIYRGLGLDLSEAEGTIYGYFFSPGADIREQILEQFDGFTSLKENGVPTSWLRGNLFGGNQLDPAGCLLELDASRLRSLKDEQFLDIPHCLADDLERFGGAEQLRGCTFCGVDAEPNMVHLGNHYEFACHDCLETLQEQARENQLPLNHPIQWKLAALALIVGTVLIGLIWGFLQQPAVQIEKSGLLMLAIPFGLSVGLAGLVSRLARGDSLWLRSVTLLCTFLGLTAGNIWGFRSMVLQQMGITWPDAVTLYFRVQLVQNPEVELVYYFGGAIGAWCGVGLLKSAGLLRFE